MNTTFTTPDGRSFFPYSYARISFAATFDGEERAGFTFVPNHEAQAAAAQLEEHGARCLLGRSADIESDDEAGFPDFRAWARAIDNICDSTRRIGGHIVLLRAR